MRKHNPSVTVSGSGEGLALMPEENSRVDSSRVKMAQKGVQLEQKRCFCSICLNLPREPVTTPCGHSYCTNCIQSFWDKEDQKELHSCPQCRETFPALEKSTMLAVSTEQLAGPEDVACDVCAGRKLKAIKSCLFCLASYCQDHLQPHYDSATFRKHKLVEPSKNLQENICSLHNEVTKMFCRTDQKSICYLCSVDEHKSHELVSASAERTERQSELELRRETIQQKLLNREKGVKLLQQQVEAISRSADKTVEDSEEIFTQLVRLIQKRSSDVTQQIRAQQETEVSRVKELQEKLEQEITELKREDAELKQLSHTEDPNQFLRNYPSVSALSESTHSSSVNIRPRRCFKDVTAAVLKLRDKLENILRDNWTNVSPTVTDLNILPSQQEPKSRADFLKYACEITLDPNTAHAKLLLSEGNRKVSFTKQHQLYSSHPDRFTEWNQVLSNESLTGRCYWEVECSRRVYIAVTYKSINRAGGGNDCGFGRNNKSWALYYFQYGCDFLHNNVSTSISGLKSSRVGVYLDHGAGILSFYSISDAMTLLHRVQTTFSQPLYTGLRIYGAENTAKFCKLMETEFTDG